MDPTSVESYFSNLIRSNPSKTAALAAIETLLECVRRSSSETLVGLNDELNDAVEAIMEVDCSRTSISSATELFKRFITLASLDQPDFAECKKILLARGKLFVEQVAMSRQKIAASARPFIRNGSRILTHSFSRAVLEALSHAAKENRASFYVYVTESAPDYKGREMSYQLEKLGISCTLILDSAVGYIMENVDFVLFGAEGVMENGGIINKIGTYTISACAKNANKPVYVVAESIKFVKEYPLNQRDIPDCFKYSTSVMKSGSSLTKEHPLVDYTPPNFLSLLFTDLGVMTPAAVSDELVKLYL